MSGQISEEQVRQIAHLARLECGEAELRQYAGELSRVLEYVEKLQGLDLDDVPPTAHALKLTNVYREDIERPSLPNEAALANCAETERGHFKVPQIIQEDSAT